MSELKYTKDTFKHAKDNYEKAAYEFEAEVVEYLSHVLDNIAVIVLANSSAKALQTIPLYLRDIAEVHFANILVAKNFLGKEVLARVATVLIKDGFTLAIKTKSGERGMSTYISVAIHVDNVYEFAKHVLDPGSAGFVIGGWKK